MNKEQLHPVSEIIYMEEWVDPPPENNLMMSVISSVIGQKRTSGLLVPDTSAAHV